MQFEDIKLYGINSSVFAISFTEIEMALKIILLIATIIYTVQKIYKNSKKDKSLWIREVFSFIHFGTKQNDPVFILRTQVGVKQLTKKNIEVKEDEPRKNRIP